MTPDGAGLAASYNSHMTTITSDITSEAIAHRYVARSWRFVATFLAGAALASAVAVGVGVTADDGAATPTPAQPSVVYLHPGTGHHECAQVSPGPC